MEQNAQRIFYESIDANTPYQKEFFGYDPLGYSTQKESSSVLVWWEDRKQLSYTDWLSPETLKVLDLFSMILLWVPFVEQAFIAWWATFWESNWPIDIVVVSNTRRVRIVKICITMVLVVLNISMKKKNSCVLRLSLLVDRVHSDCSWVRSWVWDLMSTYRIAHCSAIYEQYEEWSSQFFKANTWIKYTIPTHPLCSVIRLWVIKKQGRSVFRKWLESLFSWVVGDWINSIFFYFNTMFSGLWYRYEKISRAAPWVWWEQIKSKRSLLKWKISQKKIVDS